MTKLVKELKVGDKFISPRYTERVEATVKWISRVYVNSHLIDDGISLFELDGNRQVEIVE